MEIDIDDNGVEEIAVIGLAGRFPQADDAAAFWRNLCDGVDCLHEFSDDELDALGIPVSVYGRENFVRRGTVLPDMDRFDAPFFGFTPREAALTDPQARVFLETCYTALEHAGYNPLETPVPVGVFAGSNPNDYATLLGTPDPTDSLTAFDQLIATDKDFLATRVSHRLNLRGPALNVQTACSTSLVTIHLAARSLLDYQCSMALAGGVSVNLRQGVGYFAQQGMILSPDGRCRAFDENANGTTLGQAAGVVVLKRLSEALADNDTVYAVLKASALNNDGAAKISYTAPSEDGQVEVIAMTHALAGVSADHISYVETHGTGTRLGDPIEIAALRRAFRATSDRIGYCAIGSVKTNVGHTDAAAGVTGFIKTVLALHHRKLPPSLHFSKPNPALDIETSPFFVNTELREWRSDGQPRLAAISSFGIGGTNAHAVLSEAPAVHRADEPTGPQNIVLSAKSPEALDAMADDLANWLDADNSHCVADAAFTLQTGRGVFEHRLSVVVDARDGAALRGGNASGVVRGRAMSRPDVVFLFSGQGAQYPSMVRDLLARESVFKREFDTCAERFGAYLDADLRALVLADATDVDAGETLRQTRFTQPALFCVEYAMARQLIAWGLQPAALLGHSIGEYAALCLAGVLSLDDAIAAVAERGKLMQAMEPGAMLAVHANADALGELPDGIALAAVNTPDMTVVAGPGEAIERYAATLTAASMRHSALRTSHAFHSSMMTPMLDGYRAFLKGLTFHPPVIPIVSNVTGKWLTDDEAMDPDFWCRQIRQTVRFREAAATLLANGHDHIFIEVGPGRTLTGFVRECHGAAETASSPPGGMVAISAIRHLQDARRDDIVLLDAVGRSWVAGAEVNWTALHETGRRRIALPTYRFQRQLHWAPSARHLLANPVAAADAGKPPAPKRLPMDQWLYAPSWRRLAERRRVEPGTCLVVGRSGAPLDAFRAALAAAGAAVVTATASSGEGIAALFDSLRAQNEVPDRVVHFTSAQIERRPASAGDFDAALATGLDNVLDLVRAMGRLSSSHPMQLEIVTTGVHQVLGDEEIRPEAAALLGPAKVVALEYPNIRCRLIDLDGSLHTRHAQTLCDVLLTEPGSEPSLALRKGYQWQPDFCPLGVDADAPLPLKMGGCYLIVGGLGGVGLNIAEHLATRYQARLALTGRSGRPQVEPGSDDTELARRMALLEKVEAAAKRVAILTVDASQLDAMQAAVADAERDLGPFDGVIVAAGVADMAGAIHHRSREANRAAIASKADGSFVLEQVFADRRLDFLFLSSSIATALYHNRFAQVGYVSGNSVAEAYGLMSLPSGTPVFAVAWDDWMDMGMSVRAARQFAQTYGNAVSLVDEVHSFTPAEGVALFERVLRAGPGLLYVSTSDLPARVREDIHAVSPFLAQALDGDEGTVEREAGESQLQTVLRVWQNLLGLDKIGADDDFFALGGDSLQVARMVDRLSRLLEVDVPLNTVFDAPTPRLLDQALTALAHGGSTDHDQSDVVGDVVLSPGQRRFLARGSVRPSHFNVSVAVRSNRAVPETVVLKAVKMLYQHHDALRMRFRCTADGWSQTAEAAAWDDRIYAQHDLSGLKPEARRERFLEIATAIQTGFDLENTPLVSVQQFDFGDEGQRLLLVAHHLVVDRLSLLVLLDHLDLICNQLLAGGSPELPRKTTSFKGWTSMLDNLSRSTDLDDDRRRWAQSNLASVRPLPLDLEPDGQEMVNSNARSLWFKIEGDRARELLSGKVDQRLLMGLSRALADWTGSDVALIDVLGHGRRLVGAPIDVARTVGYFLTYSTVLLDLSDAAPDSLEVQLQTGPARGWTLDLLRDGALAAAPRAQVLFNFVGREIDVQSDSLWSIADDVDRGPETDTAGRRDHPLAVYMETGDDVINIRFVYSMKLHSESTITSLAHAMINAAIPTGVPEMAGGQ